MLYSAIQFYIYQNNTYQYDYHFRCREGTFGSSVSSIPSGMIIKATINKMYSFRKDRIYNGHK